MIAYRAETGMCGLLREELVRVEDARPLVRDLFQRDANLYPEPEQGRLRVEVHHMTNPQADRVVAKLLEKTQHAAMRLSRHKTDALLHFGIILIAPRPGGLKLATECRTTLANSVKGIGRPLSDRQRGRCARR